MFKSRFLHESRKLHGCFYFQQRSNSTGNTRCHEDPGLQRWGSAGLSGPGPPAAATAVWLIQYRSFWHLARELDSSVASEECSERPEGWTCPTPSLQSDPLTQPTPSPNPFHLYPQPTSVPSPQIAPPRIRIMCQLNLSSGDHRTAEWEWGPFYFEKGLLITVRLAWSQECGLRAPLVNFQGPRPTLRLAFAFALALCSPLYLRSLEGPSRPCWTSGWREMHSLDACSSWYINYSVQDLSTLTARPSPSQGSSPLNLGPEHFSG